METSLQIHCLILEDSYYTSIEIEGMLESLSNGLVKVYVAEATYEAEVILSRHPIDLIIADTTVSDGSSINFLIRKGISSPIILYSEYDRESLQTENLNVIDCLMLPPSLETLRRSLIKYNAVFA